ncbi:hypothetical protein KY332_00895 [Candidatus Woesearchaeota archaeon]|nr:hypothetical protein [Candidatus Woesearchaeota archaeon]
MNEDHDELPSGYMVDPFYIEEYELKFKEIGLEIKLNKIVSYIEEEAVSNEVAYIKLNSILDNLLEKWMDEDDS